MALDWILQLAASGGAALAGAAAADAWKYARDGFTRLAGRGDPELERQLSRKLDATAAQVEQAPEQDRPRVREIEQAAWRTRIADLIDEHPEHATDLADLVRGIQERLPRAEQKWVQHVVVSGPGAQANVVQGGTLYTTYPPPAT